MMEFKITRLGDGGYVVKNAFFDVVFSSTRIDESLMYIRDRMQPDPLASEPLAMSMRLSRHA